MINGYNVSSPGGRSERLDGGRKEVESKRKILLTFFDRLISETPSQNDALVAIVPTKRLLSSRLKSGLRLDIFPRIFLWSRPTYTVHLGERKCTHKFWV